MLIKNKIIFPLIYLLVIVACEPVSNENKSRDSSNKDSILVYLKYSEDAKYDLNQKINFAQKAYNLAEKNRIDSLKNIASLKLSFLYFSSRNQKLFKKQNKQSLSLAISSQDSSSIARSYGYFGNFYLKNDRNDSAYYYFRKAKIIYGKLDGRRLNVGNMLLNMAIAQKNERDYIGGEVTTIEAINFLPDEGEERTLSSAYNNLGIISNRLENYDKAIEYHEKAFKLRKEIKNERLQVSSLNNIAGVHINAKNYNKAINAYNEALKYSEVLITRPLTHVNLLENLAYAKFLNGNKDNFPEIYLKSLNVRDSLDDIPGIIESNMHLAEYYSSEKDITKALNYAINARDVAENSKNYGQELEPLLFISKLDDNEIGKKASLRYIQISDSLQKEERAKRNQFARIRFETDQIVQKNKKISRQLELLFVITGIGFAFSVLIYIIFKQKARNRRLRFDQVQQRSNEEIYNLMITQQQKIEEGRHMEKQRVSRELHDGVLSKLFGTRLSLDSLNARNDLEAIENRSRYLHELSAIEQEIRQISHDLNREIFNPNLGYTEVISNLIRSQEKINSSVRYTFNNDTTINWDRIQNKIKIHLYRIIQESLQNINKHAYASNVSVNFKKIENSLNVEIVDDGVGFGNGKVRDGIGLKNIKSRIKEIDGKLSFDSEKGKGTKISVSIELEIAPHEITNDYEYGKKVEHSND